MHVVLGSNSSIAAVETSVSEVFLIQTVTHIHTKLVTKESTCRHIRRDFVFDFVLFYTLSVSALCKLLLSL